MIMKKRFMCLFLVFVMVALSAGQMQAEDSGKKFESHVVKKTKRFKVEEISADTYKVTFFTGRIVDVFNLEAGNFITIIDVSDPSKVFQYISEMAKAFPLEIGYKKRINSDSPLEFKGKKGEFVIFKYEKS